MPAFKMHKVYDSVRSIVRTFTDNEEQTHLRVSLIARQLYLDGLLTAAQLYCGSVIESVEEDEDMLPCDECSADVKLDELISMGEERLCPKCHAAWAAGRDLCTHAWSENQDDMGDPGHQCDRCGWFIPRCPVVALPRQGNWTTRDVPAAKPSHE